MHLIYTIFVGLAAGLIARALTLGRSPSGFLFTAVLGIAGSLVAAFVGQALHLYPPGQSAGFIASITGAIVLLVVYHLFARNSAKT